MLDDMSKEDMEQGFEEMDLSDLTAEEKIKKYFSFYEGCEKWINPEKVYKMYSESKKIIPSKMFKSEIFRTILLNVGNMKELDERLSEIQYQRVGDYYRIDGLWDIYRTPFLIDDQGKFIEEGPMNFNPFKERTISDESDMNIFTDFLDEDKIDVLSKQIKSIFSNLTVIHPEKNFDIDLSHLGVFGNVIKINSISEDFEVEFEKFYEIKSDGTLEEIEVRRKKEIY